MNEPAAVSSRLRRLARRIVYSETVLGTGTGYRLWLKRSYGASRVWKAPVASWRNAALKTRAEWEAAASQVEALGLPSHPTRSKNWDGLAALACVLEHTSPSAAVLDAGAGLYSVILPSLFLYGYRNLFGVNIDFSRPIRRGPIRYTPGDVTRTSFAPSSLDAVVCQSVIEHGVNVDAYLAEMARILKPGGLLVTSFDYYDEPTHTKGAAPFGLPYRIFSRADVLVMVGAAGSLGFSVTGPLDLACEERAIRWEECALEYTYFNLVLRLGRAGLG